LEKLRNKYLNAALKSDRHSRQQSFIKRKTLNPDFRSALKKSITTIGCSPARKIDFNSSNDLIKKLENENGGKEKEDKVKKHKMFKKKHIGNMIDNYLQSFYHDFNEKFTDMAMQKNYEIFNEGYRKKRRSLLNIMIKIWILSLW